MYMYVIQVLFLCKEALIQSAIVYRDFSTYTCTTFIIHVLKYPLNWLMVTTEVALDLHKLPIYTNSKGNGDIPEHP